MKMTKHSTEVKAEARKVFEQHADHWDIEIQQRACEYLKMLKVQESGADQFVRDALEKMPNFSEDI